MNDRFMGYKSHRDKHWAGSSQLACPLAKGREQITADDASHAPEELLGGEQEKWVVGGPKIKNNK